VDSGTARSVSLSFSRAETATGMALLTLAHFLVKGVRLSRWRRTLGRPVAADENVSLPCEAAAQAKPRALAASISRADWRLPLPTKCLARAVALQWRLRLSGFPSLLVIAVHRSDRNGQEAFHAWVEREEEILIGQCDRAAYRPIMLFAQGLPASMSCASSAR
jgi:hypothetical protein